MTALAAEYSALVIVVVARARGVSENAGNITAANTELGGKR
jgi:hypothetical protein